MKKNNIRKIALLLATLELLTLGGCKSTDKTANNDNNTATFWYDEDGVLYKSVKIAPIVEEVMQPVISSKVNEDGSVEDVTTYVYRYQYVAPSEATRVEGSGSNMVCYIDYPIYEQDTTYTLIR